MPRQSINGNQVGFRDDTSYLAVHYGGRMTRRKSTDTTTESMRELNQTDRTNVSGHEPPPQPSTGTIGGVRGYNGSGYLALPPSCESERRQPRKTPRAGKVNKAVLKRPSLSEQLASIGHAAETITADIRKKHGLKPLQGAIITTPSESFLVGKLRCKYPSPIHFFNHKCVYIFHHPFEATRITMEMFFRDMRDSVLDFSRRHLRFKIDHPLCHYRRDYAHDDPSHFVVVEFSSDLDVQRVAKEIMPLIRQHSRVIC